MTSILRDVWDLLWFRILYTASILFTLYFFAKGFWSVYFIIIFINTFFDILEHKELNLKKLLKKHFITFLVLGVLYLFYSLVGLGGAAALVVFSAALLLFWAGFLIWQNWKLYDSVTSWGAKRIKGETKEEFNLKEAMRK